MSVTIDGIKYWIRKDYLQRLGIPRSRKDIEITARPDAYTSGQAPGGIWQRSESGIALYLPGRVDIREELQRIALKLEAERKAAGEATEKASGTKHLSTKDKVRSLIAACTQFAGVGTRKAKLALNKLSKTDPYAHALRVALEIEDVNLTAKRYFGGDCGGYSYAEIAYMKKNENIETLIGICQSQGWVFGVQTTGASVEIDSKCSRCGGTRNCNYGDDDWPDYHTCDLCNGSGKSNRVTRQQQQTHIIYFDIPGVGQLSWHYSPKTVLPVYPGQWDGQEGSTLPKLAAAISTVLATMKAA